MSRTRDSIYYDGACGMCRRTSRWLKRLDWLGLLSVHDMTRTPPDELPVSPDAAMRGMPMRTRSGRVHVGFPAVRRALVQTPLGAIPAVLLYLPVFSQVGCALYGRVAASRRRDACAVDAASMRAGTRQGPGAPQ